MVGLLPSAVVLSRVVTHSINDTAAYVHSGLGISAEESGGRTASETRYRLVRDPRDRDGQAGS